MASKICRTTITCYCSGSAAPGIICLRQWYLCRSPGMKASSRKLVELDQNPDHTGPSGGLDSVRANASAAAPAADFALFLWHQRSGRHWTL